MSEHDEAQDDSMGRGEEPMGERDALLSELLCLALDESAASDQARLAVQTDPELAAELQALRAFRSRVQRLAAEEEAAELDDTSDGPLIQRVLAASTREDLGWRGELSVWRGFLQRRLRESALVRLAAASLLLHLFAVPAVLAWVFAQERRAEPMIWIGDVPPAGSFPDAEEAQPVELESEGNLEQELDAMQARSAARQHLLDDLLPRPDGEPTSRAEELLALRSRGPLAVLAADQRVEADGDGPFERALLAELWLDRVAAGEEPGELHGLLARLIQDRTAAAEAGPLVELCLARAASYGLPLPTLTALPGIERDPFHPAAPLDPKWRAALRAAQAAGLLESGPVSQAWTR